MTQKKIKLKKSTRFLRILKNDLINYQLFKKKFVYRLPILQALEYIDSANTWINLFPDVYIEILAIDGDSLDGSPSTCDALESRAVKTEV